MKKLLIAVVLVSVFIGPLALPVAIAAGACDGTYTVTSELNPEVTFCRQYGGGYSIYIGNTVFLSDIRYPILDVVIEGGFVLVVTDQLPHERNGLLFTVYGLNGQVYLSTANYTEERSVTAYSLAVFVDEQMRLTPRLFVTTSSEYQDHYELSIWEFVQDTADDLRSVYLVPSEAAEISFIELVEVDIAVFQMSSGEVWRYNPAEGWILQLQGVSGSPVLGVAYNRGELFVLSDNLYVFKGDHLTSTIEFSNAVGIGQGVDGAVYVILSTGLMEVYSPDPESN